jgi:outer membrane protein TolC
LRLNDAIAIALKENYDIQVSILKNEVEEMQVYKSNAGIGPEIDWNANLNITGNNVNQKYIDGRLVNRLGRSYNPSTNFSLGITLFDGGRMQANYERLGLLSELSELEGKIVIQNTVVEVMETYYDIVRQKQALSFLNTIIKYYVERLKITEERWKVGQGSKLDFLQSKSDLNAQLSLLNVANNNLENGKVRLNGLLNNDPTTDFDTEELGAVTSSYDQNILFQTALKDNRDILHLQKTLEISKKREEEIASERRIQVGANADIGYSYNKTNAGFLLSNQNLSARGSLNSRYNIYDGQHRKKQIAISKINSQIIEKERENLEALIKTNLTFAFNRFISDKELLSLEEENRVIAEENLSIALEKFRLGGSSILELNEAQRTYDTALNRLVNANYNIRISELELLSLSGSLVE